MSFIDRIFAKQIHEQAAKQSDIYTKAARLADLYYENVFRWMNNDMPVMKPESFDYAKDAYFSSTSVYECLSLLFNHIMSYKWIQYEIVDGGKEREWKQKARSEDFNDRMIAKVLKQYAVQEIYDPKIDKLLRDPNSQMSGRHLTGLSFLMLGLYGNSYMYGNAGDLRSKKWTELFQLPNEMYIKSGGMFDPIKKYFLYYQTDDQKEFPVEQILHMKTLNPSWDAMGSQLYGVSPLRAYLRSLLTEKIGKDAINKIVNNGGAFGILAPKAKEDQLGLDQRNQLKERLSDAHRGNDPLSRVFPFSIPLEWLQIGLPSADLQLLELAGATRDDIYRCYHIPFTYANNDKSTFNNNSTDGKRLIYDAVAPWCEILSEGFTKFICEPYNSAGKRRVLTLDYLSAPELSEDMGKVMEWVERAIKNGVITPDEARGVIGFGETQLEYMKQFYVGSGMRLLKDIYEGKNLGSGPDNKVEGN